MPLISRNSSDGTVTEGVIEHVLSVRCFWSIRLIRFVGDVKAHAPDRMVCSGQVRAADKHGTGLSAAAAAEFGRRGQPSSSCSMLLLARQ